MSSFSKALPYIGPAVSIAGTIYSARSQRSQADAAIKTAEAAANAEKVSAEFEARHQEYLAGQAIGASHRAAYEERRAAALLASKALANAAASGAGASDPDVTGLLADIQAEGSYRSALALYEGENEAYNRKLAAQARRIGGSSAAAATIAEGRGVASAARTNAFSTILRGASSWIDNYGDIFTRSA